MKGYFSRKKKKLYDKDDMRIGMEALKDLEFDRYSQGRGDSNKNSWQCKLY